MDIKKVTALKGYQYDDLTPENQAIIDALHWLKGKVEIFEYEPDCDHIAALRAIEIDVGKEVMWQLLRHMESCIADGQIVLAEQQAGDNKGSDTPHEQDKHQHGADL